MVISLWKLLWRRKCSGYNFLGRKFSWCKLQNFHNGIFSCGRRQSRLGSRKNPPEIIKPLLSFVDKRNQRKVNLFQKQTLKFDLTWSTLFKQIQPIKGVRWSNKTINLGRKAVAPSSHKTKTFLALSSQFNPMELKSSKGDFSVANQKPAVLQLGGELREPYPTDWPMIDRWLVSSL